MMTPAFRRSTKARKASSAAGQGWVEPMMPTLVAKPPEGPEWTHEIKYDGYRTHIVVAGGAARAYTRRGYDWTRKYQPVVDAARQLGRDCHLEGELIVQDERGRPDIEALRGEIEAGGSGRLILYAFDLLSLDGTDVRDWPCEERRAHLAELLGPADPQSQIHFSEGHEGSGAEFFAAVDAMGLEGIVSKRRDSRYQSGETKQWLKTKAYVESTFTVLGYDSKPGRASSLLLGANQGGSLRYVGRAMVTLRGAKREAIWEQLERHRAEHAPLPELEGRAKEWFEPAVQVRARHLRGEDSLRHATLLGVAKS